MVGGDFMMGETATYGTHATWKAGTVFMFLSLLLWPVRGQQTEPVSLSSLVRNYQQNVPNDLMLLQTDRDLYFTGERIRFAGWTLDDLTGMPVDRHRVGYSELINSIGQPVAQQTVAMAAGHLEGVMSLPLDLPSGTYYLRVYAAWQKQFGPGLFAVRLVQVINPYLPPRDLKPKDPSLRCRVYPEGGMFLVGIENLGVITLKNERGIYQRLEQGCIVNDLGDTVSPIKTVGIGIGGFRFIPEKDRSYTILVKGCTPVLLKPAGEGIKLGITETRSSLVIRWDKGELPGKSALCLLGMQEGKLFLEIQLDRKLPGDQHLLEKNDLPEGLLEFLIVDDRLNRLSSRLVLNLEESSSPALQVSTDKQIYGPGELVHLEILNAGSIKLTHLAVKVTNSLFSIPYLNHDPAVILHLNSQLNDWDDFRQLSENPGMGMDRSLIDQYLITRTLVRHPWEFITGHQRFTFREAAEHQFRIFHGTASTSFGETPLINQDLHVYFSEREPYLLKTRTDTTGRFTLLLPGSFHQKQLIQFQPPLPDIGLAIRMDYPYHPEYHPYRMHYYYFDSLRIEAYDRAFVNWQIRMLHEHNTKSPASREPDAHLSSFYGSAGNRFYLEDYITFLNLEEVFKEIIGNVKIRGREGVSSFEVYDMVTNTVIGEHPLILFNGQPAEDVEAMLMIPEKEVEYVDVVPRRFFVGPYSYDGVVNVVTWDRYRQLEVPKHNYRTVLEGTEPANDIRESPVKETSASNIPDFRNTLLWEPQVPVTGGNIRLKFFTGDDTGTYQITATGIYETGQTFRVQQEIRVESSH
jgi:hypothetical protein